MKKILVIITTGFVSYGGLTTVAMNYYRSIDRKKISMDFSCTNDIEPDLKAELIENGSIYHKLPNRKNIMQYISRLKHICKEYDSVHIHGNSSTLTIELLAAKLAGVSQRIVHIHNTTCTHRIANRVLHPFFTTLYTDAIACSQKAGDWIFDREFYVLNNAIDLNKYRFSETNRIEIKNLYGLTDECIVGHVGKFNEQKNHQFLLSIFKDFLKAHPNSVLMMVGGGELQPYIKKRAQKIGIADKVIFTGMLNDTSKYYSVFDCFVMPSLWEGLPLSAIEAQAAGLRCVFSDKITSEIDLTKENIFLSLKDEINNWSYALETSCDNRPRNALCERYISYLKDVGFDADTNAEILMKIYSL